MADFYQHARLPTLHHLATPDAAEREAELVRLTQDRPVALLLPALSTEMTRPALPGILRQVAAVPYISQVVLSMNGTQDADLIRRSLSTCQEWLAGKPLTLLWNDGPALDAVHARISPRHVHGKGANIWMGLAWLHAAGHRGIIVSHDTDILNYGPSLLAKLCYPVAHPRLGYRFAKGYYSRVAGRLYGRVTRLLIFPLIQAFADVLGPMPLLEHLESFRYPLSGEFAGDSATLGQFSLPSAWGLEVATLCEAHRQLRVAEMCQVDLGFHYEHRHRQLEPGSIEPGLVSAAADVARCLAWQVLREAQERAAESLLRLVLERYKVLAGEWMDRYEHVALLNGLAYDRAEEALAVTAFTEALAEIVKNAQEGRLPTPGLRPAPAAAMNDHADLRAEILAAAVGTGAL
jgi:glucosyl-3-phosphoglycerate synthase